MIFLIFWLGSAPPPGFLSFEKLLLDGPKKKTPCNRSLRQRDECYPSTVRVPPNQRHSILLTSYRAVMQEACTLYSSVAGAGGRPQAAVDVSLLISKQRSWHPKVPGEATVRNISKKCCHKMALRS